MDKTLAASLADITKEIIRNNFISSISLRFTLLFLTVLLVKILFAFYKYNIRMKHFYESKRIALELAGIEDLNRVKVFSDVYTTDKIDFVIDDLGGTGVVDVIKSAFTK